MLQPDRGTLPSISLVIPARNEQDFLPRLLDSVDAARNGYRKGPDAVEIIVADNGSADDTVDLARQRGCRIVAVEPRVIGAVRNGGAAAARGDVLAFVDADAVIHPDTFNEIDRVLVGGRVVAGSTGVRPERMSLGIAVTFALLVPVTWMAKIDTGVVFCRRSDFVEIGGYDERLRFGEDTRFLWSLRQLGRGRGQKLVRITRAKALMSTRKFDRHGDWHFLPMVFHFLLWFVFKGTRMERLADSYWYER